MDVPISLRAYREVRVGAWEKDWGEARGDNGVDEGVEECGKGDFVDMQRKGGERENVGDGTGYRLEERRGMEGEGVAHSVAVAVVVACGELCGWLLEFEIEVAESLRYSYRVILVVVRRL